MSQKPIQDVEIMVDGPYNVQEVVSCIGEFNIRNLRLDLIRTSATCEELCQINTK